MRLWAATVRLRASCVRLPAWTLRLRSLGDEASSLNRETRRTTATRRVVSPWARRSVLSPGRNSCGWCARRRDTPPSRLPHPWVSNLCSPHRRSRKSVRRYRRPARRAPPRWPGEPTAKRPPRSGAARTSRAVAALPSTRAAKPTSAAAPDFPAAPDTLETSWTAVNHST